MSNQTPVSKDSLDMIHAYFNQLEYSRKCQIELIDQIVGGESGLEKMLASEFLLEEFLKAQLMRMVGSLIPGRPVLVNPFELSDNYLLRKLEECVD
jgi:hypothetical protein